MSDSGPVKISQLPAATSLNPADLFPIVQGGITKEWSNAVGGGLAFVVASVAALKALTPPTAAMFVATEGYYTSGDGGAGTYWWNSTDTTADNGGTVLAPNAGGTGRWNLIWSGALNVRQFGAKGDGTTNDYAAVQAAITAAQSAGGAVYLPTGTYRIGSALTVNSSKSVSLFGDGLLATVVNTTSDIALLTIEGTGRHSVRDMSLQGIGVAGGSGTSCSGTSHTLSIASTCVDVYLHRLMIVGGWNGVNNLGTDTNADSCIIYNSYGVASWLQASNALWMRRCKCDNPWPVSVPSVGSTFNAWAATTAYVSGDVVSSGGFYIQCKTSGTSGSTAPTLQNYNVDIADGTAVWRLACRTSLEALEVTTGGSEVHVSATDLSGAFNKSVGVDNGSSGTAPWMIEMSGCVLSQAISATMDCIAGSGLMLSGNEIFPPLVGGANGALQLRTAWSGDASVQGNTFANGSSQGIGIYAGSGTSLTVHGNNFGGWDYSILIDAGVTQFIVSNNNLGASAKWGANNYGITVTTGASDYYNIVNNIVHGATTAGVTDNGTGTHKTVSGNN